MMGLQGGESSMALAIIGAPLEGPEHRSFGWTKVRPREAQLGSETVGMRSRHGWSRQLDRISSGIYEHAVRLQRRERQQLACLAAALQFRTELAGLKEEIRANLLSL